MSRSKRLFSDVLGHASSATQRSLRPPPAKRATAFSCSVCFKPCGSGTICCGACRLWVHMECVRMADDDRSKWEKSTLEFLCPDCAGIRGRVGVYSYKDALSRSVRQFCTYCRFAFV